MTAYSIPLSIAHCPGEINITVYSSMDIALSYIGNNITVKSPMDIAKETLVHFVNITVYSSMEIALPLRNKHHCLFLYGYCIAIEK
jgi:hypothetical protein